MKFYHDKKLGQHFLADKGIQQRIIDAANIKDTETILEIGPGAGAITQGLSKQALKVIAIEKDDRLIEPLQQKFANTNVEIIHADILKYPFENIPHGTKIIGNLPYNIATPIVEKTINHRERFTDFFMMVQLEHGLRLTAKPSCKDYGSLSCFIQYYTTVKMLFKIKPGSFNPPPKVDSCFLYMNLTGGSAQKTSNEKMLFFVIRTAFHLRRKTILNSLSAVIDKETLTPIFQALNLDPKLRAENLSLEQYIDLVDYILENKIEVRGKI